MTKHLWLAGSVLLSVGLQAQVGINAGQKTDAPQYRKIAKDAVLQVANKQGEYKGVLFPQMTTNERNTISNPTEGLTIYNTTLHCQQIYNGTSWSCSDGSHTTFIVNGKTYDGDEYVKDRNFGDGEHDFIYKVITVNGKKWLNNNLGADYANVHSDVFNPDQQAKTRKDFHAYGSLFQWQRAADGHELITWTGVNSGTPVISGTYSGPVSSYTNPGTNQFITSSSYKWTSAGSPLDLWKKDDANNPCPVGYHVPTSADWVAYHKAVTGSDTSLNTNKFWNGFDLDVLKLSAAGLRNADGASLDYSGTSGYYWSSEVSGSNYAKVFSSSSGGSSPSDDGDQGGGYSVRCLQD